MSGADFSDLTHAETSNADTSDTSEVGPEAALWHLYEQLNHAYLRRDYAWARSLLDQVDEMQDGAISAREAETEPNVDTDPMASTVLQGALGVKFIDSDDPAVERSFVRHVISANTPLPADTEPLMAATVSDMQTEIRIEIWEQAGAVASPELTHNRLVGEGTISDLSPLPAGSPVEITFRIDGTGRLNVRAVELTTNRVLDVEFDLGGLAQPAAEDLDKTILRLSVDE